MDKISKIEHAIEEANRFLRAAEAAKTDFENNPDAWFRSIPFASCKRSSMDLTRALSNLRK